MHTHPAHVLADTAANLRSVHPNVPALDVLDWVFGTRKDKAPDFSADLVAPPSQFGRLIAEAFDPARTPDEWAVWTGEGAEAAVRGALMDLWSREVLPAFRARYGIAH